MSMTNMKIKRSSTPDLICEKMEELITTGVWKVNDKIPSEAELAETFGVNRFTVRMALQKLNTLGVLETLVGDGTYVRSFSFERLLQSVSHFYMTPELLNDVSEFRAAMEVECIRLAMKRYTPEELAELEECCRTYENSITAYVNAKHDSVQRKILFEQFNDDDIALHTQLCKMSHNELLIYAYSTAKEAIR